MSSDEELETQRTGIPLLVDVPLAPSVLKSLALLEKDGYYTVHLVPFDPDVVRLALAARPCAIVLSITDEDTYQRTFEILESFRRLRAAQGAPVRDPGVRIVMVAEHWGVQLERWMELGVHEFVIAPISQKALAFKLGRHYAKALAAEVEEEVGAFSAANEVRLVREPTPSPTAQVQAYYVPATEADRADGPVFERFVIHLAAEVLGGHEAVWSPSNDSSGFDETWVCELPGRGKSTDGPAEALFFTGDRPTYDETRKVWLFRGDAPRLIRRSVDRRDSETVLVSTSPDRMKVFVKDPSSFSTVEVRKRITGKLAQKDKRMKIYSKGDFEPQLAEVQKITEYLDSWKPKSRNEVEVKGEEEKADRSRYLISGGIPESSWSPGGPREADAEPRESGERPEKPPTEHPSGHLSGPGQRDYAAEIKSILAEAAKAQGEFTPLARPGPTARPGKAEDKGKAPKARPSDEASRAVPVAPREEEPEWKSHDSSSSAPKPARRLHGAESTSADEAGELRFGRERTDEESGDESLDQREKAARESRARLTGESPDGPDRAARQSSAGKKDARPSKKARRSSDGPDDDDRDRAFSSEEDAGFNNLRDSKERPEERNARFSGEGAGDDKAKRFSADTPDGALTWSMQNDEGAGAGMKKRRDRGSAENPVDAGPEREGGNDAAASARKAPAGEASPGEDGQNDSSGLTASSMGAAGRGVPAIPERKRGWLERLRRFLSGLFS